MEAGSRTKIRGVLVWFACSLELSQGSQRYCSVLRPHLPLISPPSISSSAFPAVFLLWSLFSCFLFVVAFNNIRLYNKNRRSKQTNIQALYVTECVGVCGSTLYVCTHGRRWYLCHQKCNLSRSAGDSKNNNYLLSSTLFGRFIELWHNEIDVVCVHFSCELCDCV